MYIEHEKEQQMKGLYNKCLMKKQVLSNKNTTSKSVPTNCTDQVLKARKDCYFLKTFDTHSKNGSAISRKLFLILKKKIGFKFFDL